jgi:AcrR family transcriptional regulator
MENQIIDAYKELLISGGDLSAFSIAKKVGITEKEFYQHFTSADDIARKIWYNIGDSVIQALNGSELYNSYPARQKVLSYFFTFFDTALNERSFIDRTHKNSAVVQSYREQFNSFVGDIVQEGIATDDIKERLSLSNYYPKLLWELHQRLLQFWLEDTSENFVQTEKAVEIYSRIPLELMGSNIFDSMFETMKFNFELLKLDKIKIFN